MRPDSQSLRRLYIEERKTTREIGSLCGVSKTHVLRWLKAEGIDRILVLPAYPQYSGTTTASVFDDLFDADGASINVNPIEHYAPIGKSIEFAELVAIGRAHGESVIGYRTLKGSKHDAASGVKLNPLKTDKFKPAEGDGLVVIGDLK